LVVDGSFGQEIDVEWRVDSPNLDDFWPGLAGSLSTSGQATGPLLQPRIDVDATGEAIVLDGIEIGALSLAASVDVAGVAESDLTLDVRDARIAGRSIERLELEGDGTAARHRLAADVSVDGVESA